MRAETSSEPIRRVLLHNMSWERYERMLEAIGDAPVRLTYEIRRRIW